MSSITRSAYPLAALRTLSVIRSLLRPLGLMRSCCQQASSVLAHFRPRHIHAQQTARRSAALPSTAALCAPLAVAGILSAVVLDAGKASAYLGFTGNFDPSQWTLVQNGAEITSLDCPESGLSSVSCLDTSRSTAGSVSIGAGSSGTTQVTTWSWENKYLPTYYVEFSMDIVSSSDIDPDTGTVSVVIAGTAYPAVPLIAPNSYSTPGLIRVDYGQTIVFTTSVPGGSNPAIVTISGFQYAVPGPLPAAGAATAFGYSRRLRRRIKGQPGGAGRRRPPSDPSSYLNLPPLALQVMPVSFSYAPVAAASHVQRPSIGAAGCRFVAAD